MDAFAPRAQSSIGSDAFVCLAVIIICLLVLSLLRYFLPLRTTPAYLLGPTFLALALPASTVLLVPIDLSSGSDVSHGRSAGIWLPERAMLVAWRIIYWLCFALTWFLLPILGEFLDSGDHSPEARLKYSFRSNGRYYMILLGCCALGLVYFFLQVGVHVTNIKALVMTLGYCWSLIIAIYLMGHGLVAIPRAFFRNAKPSLRLRRIQERAPGVHDKLEDSLQRLAELESQVMELRRRKSSAPFQLRDWIEELAESSTLEEREAPSSSPGGPAHSSVPTVLTERYLADLTRQVVRARHQRARFSETWQSLIENARRTQQILDSSASQRLELGQAQLGRSAIFHITLLTPYLRYLLHVKILPIVNYIHGFAFSIASACIVWSEVSKVATHKLSIINLTVVHHARDDELSQVKFWGQVTAMAWIVYMCAAALTSINDAKIWGNRALVSRNTYGESACWYANQVAKMTIPLAYNFMTFLSPVIYRRTVFYTFLGRLINLTPLGERFDQFFPIFILVPVCATLFNIYGKVKGIFGFNALDFEDEESSADGTATWREGRDLIEREIHGPSSLGTLPRHSLFSDRAHRTEAGHRPGALPVISNNPSNRRPPTLSIPANRTSQRRAALGGRRPADTVEATASREDADEENVFTEFAHRVRNTFDSSDTPRWMQTLGDGFKKPRWLGGEGEASPPPSADGLRSGIGRWFGGGNSEGRLRI